MNDELDPLGFPPPPLETSARTLSDLVAEHPMVALAASAAVGAGVMALVAVAARPASGSRPSEQSAERSAEDIGAARQFYDNLLEQLSGLAEKVNAALPDKAAVTQTVSGFGSDAAQRFDHAAEAAKEAAKRGLHSAMATGSKATQAAVDHPLITSLVLGALGAAAAAVAASAERSQDKEADTSTPRPNGHDGAGGGSSAPTY